MLGGKEVPAKELADMIVGLHVEGLTISGGEPFLQAEALAELVRRVRALRPEMTVITFTGYPLRQVVNSELAQLSDVIIDGQYDKRLDNGLGLRGSLNQKITHMSNRLAGYDLDLWERTTEWHMQPNGEVLIVGIPTEASRLIEYEYFGEDGDMSAHKRAMRFTENWREAEALHKQRVKDLQRWRMPADNAQSASGPMVASKQQVPAAKPMEQGPMREAELVKVQCGSSMEELTEELAWTRNMLHVLEDRLDRMMAKERMQEAGITMVDGEDYLEKIGERLLESIASR
jgi:anaerobic ribonucleoside-triphosphate reductase activating protein